MSGSEALTPAETTYFESGGTQEPLAPADSTPPATEGDPAAQQPDAGVDPPPDKRTVPLGALHEERERRKDEQRRHEETRRQHAADMARVDERLRILQGAVQPQPAPLPAFAQDPQGHIDGRLAQLEQGQQLTFQQQQQIAAQQQQQAQMTAAANYARAQEGEFAAKTPDYLAGAQHLRNVRTEQLRVFAPLLGINEAQIPQIINAEIQQLANVAHQRGGNFAETIYNAAVKSGYKAAVAATGLAANDNNPAANDNNPLATAQRGQQFATTIGSAGAAVAPRLTAQALLAMPDAEFAKLLYSDKGGEIDKIMGSDNFEGTPRSSHR